MKYMIIMEASQQHYDAMAGKETEVPTWKPEELQAMYGFMNELNEDLVSRGEWVGGEGLAEPAHTRRVQRSDDGEVVVTDGPYAENKEVLAGFWIVDVESIDRATEIAAHVTTCPGPGGAVDGMPVDIRPIGEGPEQE